MFIGGRMDKENVAYVNQYYSAKKKKKKGNFALCKSMDGPRDYFAKW